MLTAFACMSLVKPNIRYMSGPKTPHIVMNTKEYVDTIQLRATSRKLGTDISRNNSQKLVDMYGNDGLVSIGDILDKSSTMSPSKYFWLNIDPDDNGIRRKRPRWNSFAKSGTLTPMRLIHYSTGVMSLAIGTIDYVDFIVSFGSPSITIHDANAHACVHTMAAAQLNLCACPHGETGFGPIAAAGAGCFRPRPFPSYLPAPLQLIACVPAPSHV